MFLEKIQNAYVLVGREFQSCREKNASTHLGSITDIWGGIQTRHTVLNVRFLRV